RGGCAPPRDSATASPGGSSMPKVATKVATLLGLAVFVLGIGRPAPATAEIKPGDTLDQSTSQGANGLLPPEILEHYKKNEYKNPIADWPASKYTWAPDYKAGTQSNEGKFK